MKNWIILTMVAVGLVLGGCGGPVSPSSSKNSTSALDDILAGITNNPDAYPDTDGDGIPDALEKELGLDPNSATTAEEMNAALCSYFTQTGDARADDYCSAASSPTDSLSTSEWTAENTLSLLGMSATLITAILNFQASKGKNAQTLWIAIPTKIGNSSALPSAEKDLQGAVFTNTTTPGSTFTFGTNSSGSAYIQAVLDAQDSGSYTAKGGVLVLISNNSGLGTKGVALDVTMGCKPSDDGTKIKQPAEGTPGNIYKFSMTGKYNNGIEVKATDYTYTRDKIGCI